MTTEAEAVAKLAGASAKAHFVKSEDGREFLIVPDEFKHQEVTLDDALPVYEAHHIKQAVILQTQESLIDYVIRYGGADTTLFADIAVSTIVGQIDYHAKETPAPIAHKASLVLPFSEEWRCWTAISGKLMGQLEFARFLEENGADVAAPDAATLLEACRDLQAHRKVNFTKAVRTSSENENFEFTVENEARTKGGIELPTKFKLSIPVYFGEPETELFAFLRWKIAEGGDGLSLGIALHRAEYVRQAVFQQIVQRAAELTSCPALFGKI
jgi:uncharacterized protein YfdQ (DUF2303 family)